MNELIRFVEGKIEKCQNLKISDNSPFYLNAQYEIEQFKKILNIIKDKTEQ